MWECSSIGAAQADASDPQQFLGFGLILGQGDDGVVRGALVLTMCLRVGMFVAILFFAKSKAPTRRRRRRRIR